MTFTSSSAESEGEFAPSDADWNYKDIPHLNELHNLVEGIPTAIGDDIITTVFMQKIGFLRIPLTVVNYAINNSAQVYYTTLGPYCLVIETQWTATSPTTTNVLTAYNLGSPRFLKFTHVVAHKLLANNYKTLMSADMPMRRRRGFLRQLGYSFRGDLHGYSFLETLRIAENNLISPLGLDQFVWTSGIHEIPSGRTEIGQPTTVGLIIERDGSVLKLYDRTCGHEGALLDQALLQDDCLRCPWHGRLNRPLGYLSLEEAVSQFVGGGVTATSSEGVVTILISR